MAAAGSASAAGRCARTADAKAAAATLRNPCNHFDAVVIGAGAAGLFCAGIAGQRGLKVLLLDHGEQGRREDPHLRRRPLQLHQPRPRPARAAQALPGRQPELLPLGAVALHAAATSSPWCSATASPSTRSTRASCSATAPPKTSSGMLLRECEAGGVQHWQPCARGRRCAARRRRLSSSTPTAARARARARHRHRRPVDPEDRRHRLRLPHRAAVRPARRRAAPGAGAADLRRRGLGALRRSWPGWRCRCASRPAQKKARMRFRRRPAVHAPRPGGPGGAADLQLLAPGTPHHASTSPRAPTWRSELLRGQGRARASCIANELAALVPAAPGRRLGAAGRRPGSGR